jgi:hypothetical protein
MPKNPNYHSMEFVMTDKEKQDQNDDKYKERVIKKRGPDDIRHPGRI